MAGKKPKCKLIAYIRVSTKRQGSSGLGLEAQQAAIEAHAASKGCTIVARFVEVESGKRDDRPELLKAIAHAKRSGAAIVVSKLDRLSRDVHFISGLMKTEVDFIACDCPDDDITMLHFRATMAEDERRKISIRTKEALAAYKARGGVLGKNNLTDEGMTRGRLAGATAHKEKAVSAYADLVPMMKAMKAEGKSLQQIADALNAEGHCTQHKSKTEPGKVFPWGPVQVMRALARA